MLPSDPTGIVPSKADASTAVTSETAEGGMSFMEALDNTEPDVGNLLYVFKQLHDHIP